MFYKGGTSAVFNPSEESTNAEQKKKKKKAVTISRPFKFWVVILEHYQEKVPKGSRRKNLNDAGRVQKLEFRRTLSRQQVKNLLIAGCGFFKSDLDTTLKLYDVTQSFPNGQEIAEIASKESLYIVEGSAEVMTRTII